MPHNEDGNLFSQAQKRELIELFEEALDRHYERHNLSSDQHSKDHAFISSWRCASDTVKTTTLRWSIRIVLVGLGGLIWLGFKMALGKG